jgi:ABC-2 type transport system permease protein
VRQVNRFRMLVTAELTKISTVRSTRRALLLTPLIARLPAAQRQDFDPLFATFYSLSVGQLALVVFGATAVGNEYSSGTIALSLIAVPRRDLFYAAKLTAGLLAAAVTALATVTADFFAAQQALGPHGTTIGAPGTLQAAAGGCLYLTLICALAMGVTTITRSTARSLVIMLPLLFLDSQGLGNVPGLQKVIDYLPDQAGAVIIHLSASGGGRFGRPFGPWAGVAIMLAWTAVVVAGGYLMRARTDVTR